MSEQIVLPFLKWAGGKRWLVRDHPDIFPADFNTYIEPFLGSGSVFFHMQPKKALLSDANKELIITYQALRNRNRKVESLLKRYHACHSEEFYYFMRGQEPKKQEEIAARMIYLNRTCWNGLYRVNLSGRFNVPKGTKKNVILDTDNFKETARLLRRSKIVHSDFEKIIDSAQENDFVFVDPPYTVKHNLNGFVKYNEKLFSWDDQVRLKLAIDRATARGAKVLLTNADHESILSLYDNYISRNTLSRNSVLSGKSEFRGEFSELTIKCWI
ncbi:Dam family site-specific DNA-(adenine-N6)-methyltransferase [Halomonas sp. DP8Y7-3]|uniref:DNA adenine methylase n=1 Tax=Halomonas sp. DP8Y7-3 TaxID=2859079 RepID=UPI001C98DD06|nr:Dam family site-specific DNA-(adenine-N6)-methyltransferase [Halomonas sp. DP8Y7-3]MBY5930799.1 Dam family site-specific DNA-(adenine-N6)-methyltransferase [Halomonas sp. DP8Y7-3]